MNNAVLLSGKRGVYCQVDVSTFLASSPINLTKIEQDLSVLGFNQLGNIFCSSLSGIFVRGYAQSQGVTYASLVMRLEENYLTLASIDFYSVLATTASLTTSIVPELKDCPEKKIYKTSAASSSIKDIHREHERRLEILAREHGTPRVAESSLSAMAASIDEFLDREAA